jgi:serine/threonine-protein kinase
MGAIAAAMFFGLAIYTNHLHPLFTANNALTQTLMMTIAVLTGVWGVYNMTRLRTEAYEAKQMGNYKLLRKIGTGGMGEVYLAEHQLMKRPVAIKLIHPNQSHDPHALARFEREVRATAKLSHWNSIEIYDYGRTPDGTFYYVMEFLPGLSVADLVERNGPMPGERVVYLLQQVCAGLQEAHSLGLIHRDLKPGNIFSAYRGGFYDVAKLLDFGLAKPVMSNSAMDLTVAGAITGSPLYMSPEQAIGEREPDARSDIYSLGGVAYFMLTGHSPFEGTNPIRVMWAHAEQTPVAPSQHNPNISPDLEAIVMKCLAKSPEDRFANTVELSNAMANCSFDHQWTTARAEEWWETYCSGNYEGSACAQAEAIMSAEI